MTDAPNEGEEDTKQHELVIIRRRADGEDAGHHGGVWKIAHADFMTALMAFFLVMWLITATDETTVSAVANYFNPMRLSDETTKPKGVFTMEPGESKKKQRKTKEAPTAEQDTPAEPSEAQLFSDPYNALDKIAAEATKGAAKPPSEESRGPAQRGGQAFRDPFNPDSHPRSLPQRKAEVQLPKDDEGATTAARNGADRKADSGSQAGEEASKQDGGGATFARNGSERGDLSRPKEPTSRETNRAASASLAKQIESLIAQSQFSALPGIDVRATREGVLISITDQYDFEMFGIASARPKPELVVLMGKIGTILAKRPEQIIVRGHTDGRPFRSRDYDNWRLSSARAQMAHYMLVRSGIPEARIDHIEGYADHELRVRGDPLAAANRRIEILLEKGEP
jgi:chemotaxis protein MotB